MLDRETSLQIAVSVGAVGLFLAIAVAVTDAFSSNGNISETGAFALVGAIAVFIVVMSIAGLWLERQDFDEDGN